VKHMQIRVDDLEVYNRFKLYLLMSDQSAQEFFLKCIDKALTKSKKK